MKIQNAIASAASAAWREYSKCLSAARGANNEFSRRDYELQAQAALDRHFELLEGHLREES